MAETLPSADELLPSLFDELPGDVVYQQLKAANGSFELACAKLLVIRATYRLGAAPDAAPAQPLLAPGKEDDDRAPAARGGPPLEMSKRERVRLDMIEVYAHHNPAKVRDVDELMKRATKDKEESVLAVLRQKYAGRRPPACEPKRAASPAPRRRATTAPRRSPSPRRAASPRRGASPRRAVSPQRAPAAARQWQARPSEDLRLVSQSSAAADDAQWAFWRRRAARRRPGDGGAFVLRGAYLERVDESAAEGLCSIHVLTIVGIRSPAAYGRRSRSLGPGARAAAPGADGDADRVEVLTPAARYAFASRRAPAWALELRAAAWGADAAVDRVQPLGLKREKGWVAPAGRASAALRALRAHTAS